LDVFRECHLVTTRILLTVIAAVVLSSCSDYPDTSPKMKQVGHLDPVTGQYTYHYVPADSQ